MAKNKNFTMENFIAGLLGAVVEDMPLEESLREVGLSEDSIFSEFVASQSSDVAKEYLMELMKQRFGEVSRSEGETLYLVKKVLCDEEDYKGIAKAVSKEHTDKFQVLRLISWKPEAIGYKQEETGLEMYLVSGKTPIEALRKTTNPAFQYSSCPLDVDEVKTFDQSVTDAVCRHTPEAVESLLSIIVHYFT